MRCYAHHFIRATVCDLRSLSDAECQLSSLRPNSLRPPRAPNRPLQFLSEVPVKYIIRQQLNRPRTKICPRSSTDRTADSASKRANSCLLAWVRTLWYNPCMPYKDRRNLYAAQKRHRLRIRAQLFTFLSTKSCVDCGERDPIVLEFDHRDSKQKFKIVSKMLSGHYSWQSVQREIYKCEIRCANCHRRKTYAQLGYWGKGKPPRFNRQDGYSIKNNPLVA